MSDILPPLHPKRPQRPKTSGQTPNPENSETSPSSPPPDTWPSARASQNSRENLLELTSDDMVYGDWKKWAHLDDRILSLRDIIQDRLVETGEAEKLPTARDNPDMRKILIQTINNYALTELIATPNVSREDRDHIIAAVTNEILGLGPLEPLWNDPTITEVLVNGPDEAFVERKGKLIKTTGIHFRDKQHLLDVCERIIQPLNRKLDVKDPTADGRLPDGSRVNVTHPSIGPKGPYLTVRRFPETHMSLADLTELGAMTREMAQLISWYVKAKLTILVSGGTGSGKRLALSTRIPTPTGWTTMGELKKGDTLFSRDGLPCRVTHLSHIETRPDLYTITFSDGQTVLADAEHQWVVSTRHDTTGTFSVSDEETVTTETMVTVLRAAEAENGDIPPLYAVRATLPIQGSAPELLQDPYTVGQEWAKNGEENLPEQWTRLPHMQRLRLLQGVMSGKGEQLSAHTYFIPTRTFTSGTVQQLVHLVRSFGAHTTETSIPGKGTGIILSTVYPVLGHTPGADLPDRETEWLQIVSITPAAPEPARCIQVDSHDSTYLVEDFIPTHNTTMLNALSAAIPRGERIITIEDSLELQLNPENHIVSLEARPRDASGHNQVTIRALVKNSLRQRPDRIIVGEVRDEAALEMLQACNTGHEGSMSTVHANGANETVSRLAVMVAQGGDIPASKVDWLVSSALDLIIMIRRYQDGSRRISGVYEVPDIVGDEPLVVVPLWEWERTDTLPDGTFVGEYRKINEISDELKKKKDLRWIPEPSWEEIARNFQ